MKSFEIWLRLLVHCYIEIELSKSHNNEMVKIRLRVLHADDKCSHLIIEKVSSIGSFMLYADLECYAWNANVTSTIRVIMPSDR